MTGLHTGRSSRYTRSSSDSLQWLLIWTTSGSNNGFNKCNNCVMYKFLHRANTPKRMGKENRWWWILFWCQYLHSNHTLLKQGIRNGERSILWSERKDLKSFCYCDCPLSFPSRSQTICMALPLWISGMASQMISKLTLGTIVYAVTCPYDIMLQVLLFCLFYWIHSRNVRHSLRGICRKGENATYLVKQSQYCRALEAVESIHSK